MVEQRQASSSARWPLNKSRGIRSREREGHGEEQRDPPGGPKLNSLSL
jgi:hypothetical protein